jgi:pyrophosphatase PpaX
MINAILFDLDGTILDTNELIIASFFHALDGEVTQPLNREQIIMNMGRPLVEQMKLFTGRDDVSDVVTKYRAFNIEKHDQIVKAFPYVKEVMEKLFRSGIKMGIVTSKVRMTTEMGLKLCGLESLLHTVVTVEDVEAPKPNPDGIKKAMAQLGVNPDSTLMVGDSHYDLEAARHAGVRSVGVAWSLKGEEYLLKHRPDYWIRDMRELLELVEAARDAW